MKNFKAIITTDEDVKVGQNQVKLVVDLPFKLKIEINKNNQIYDIQPREFAGVDIFSKYYGRTVDWCADLIQEIEDLYNE